MNDQAARDAIVFDLERNFLVEASAGTGKTHSLVARVVEGLRNGKLQPATTVVVTFTRKAASELRGRIRLELEKQLQGGALSLRGVLDEFEQIYIGTIHSFCAWVLRQHPVEAGVAPGFLEADEGLDQRLRLRTLRRFMETPQGRQVAAELGEAGVSPHHLEEGLTYVCDNGDVDYAAACAERPDTEPVWLAVDAFAEELTRLVPRPFDPKSTCPLQLACEQFLDKQRTTSRQRVYGLLYLLGLWSQELNPIFKYWGAKLPESRANVEPVRVLVESFRTSVATPFLSAWRAYLYGICCQALLAIRQAFNEERQRQGIGLRYLA